MAWWIDEHGRLYQGDMRVGDHAATQAEIDAVFNKPPTKQEEMAALNSALQSNLTALEQQYVKALLADGASEASKVSAIRSQQAALKAQYAIDYAAILAKYQ